MKKKHIFYGVGGLLVLIVAFVVVTVLSIDPIVETAVNTYGPKITQTEVVLDDADIGLFSGSGALKGFRVGNPTNRGFKPRDLMNVDRISVELDRDTLLSDTIVIKEISIDAPKITYELKGMSDSNFDALLKNIEESTGGKAEPAKEPAEGEEASPAKKIIIENVYIRGGEITADMTGMPGEGMTIPLPEIHMTDIGKEEGGASPADAVGEIISGLYDGMTDAFEASGNFVMKGGEWVIDQGAGAGEAVGGAAEDAAEGVKSLF